MAIFGCVGCGYKFEHLVSTAWRKALLRRRDHCPKCDTMQLFRFVTPTGAPSMAALWWRKQQYGKTASEPLDAVFGKGR